MSRKPSRPTLKTPLRSDRTPPTAAKIKGTDSLSAEVKILVSMPRSVNRSSTALTSPVAHL
jgi:hypothetical protein